MQSRPDALPIAPAERWYTGISRYQWLVLVIASAGWVFDAFEGQIYNITRADLLRDLVGPDEAKRKYYGDVVLMAFLLGGTLGGILFGSLADRIGRKPAMSLSILFYSVFSGLTFFATDLWQVAVLRFLVAMGVGGEWAVAASLVAEVFPAKARARAGVIFHSTSVTGAWLAALAGLAVGTNWRYAYLIGVIPALLVLWVRVGIKEPERWQEAKASKTEKLGSVHDLFAHPVWRTRAIFGLLLAAVGLGTFWGVVVAGQDLTQALLLRTGVAPDDAKEKAKFAFGFIEASGMGVGFLCFGPLAERLGRRGTFILYHLMAVAITPIICFVPQTYVQMLLLLPVFGFFTGGIHAGYAVYFPELFPNHLRATGASVCFNGGRLLAAPLLWLSASLKHEFALPVAITILASLFLLGAALMWFLPETKGTTLPE